MISQLPPKELQRLGGGYFCVQEQITYKRKILLLINRRIVAFIDVNVILENSRSLPE